MRDFDERFKNWLYWCRMKGLHQGRAASAEGAYRSPQHWDPAQPKPDWLVLMDIPDAIQVNRAFIELGPQTRRTIQVIWFKPTWKAQWKAQAIGCHHTQLADRAHHALVMLKNRLNSLEQKAKVAA